MQASSRTPTANKPQAPTHPNTTLNNKPNITLSQNCPHQTVDNHGNTNCTRSDSTIGLCQNPCPYKNATTTASRCERYYLEKRGESSFLQAAYGEISCFQAVQLRCYLLALAAAVVVF